MSRELQRQDSRAGSPHGVGIEGAQAGQPGRVFAMTQQDAQASLEVVARLIIW